MGKKRSVLSGMLLAIMVCSFFNASITTNASTLPEDNSNALELIEITNEEIVPETIQEEYKANIIERTYNGENYTVTEGISAYSASDDSTSNTNPSYAYVVTNDTVTQGAIETDHEMRWYAFTLSEKSKVTILLQMVDTLDADLYLFAYNEETYELELIGGSAVEGAGTTEYFNSVMETGIYFFAVSGYEGTGAFAFAYYQSSTDVQNEINDTTSEATEITFNSDIVGVIDNPNDRDFYKFTVTKPTVVQYSIISSNGYSLLYAGGTYYGVYLISADNNTYKFMPGTYYFAAMSENGAYSASSTYTVNFRKVGEMSSDSSITLVGVCEPARIVYETNSSRTVNYINGNPIDISYSCYETYAFAEGFQSYDISIDANAGARVSFSQAYAPAAVYYNYSTRPAMNVSGRPALMLTYISEKPFYKIHCSTTGAFSENNFWDDLGVVTVLIDPETGKLIDITEFNYFYDFAVGSNRIDWSSGYKMIFYNN